MIEVTTKSGQHLTDDYRRINPRQQVPTLVLPDGTVVTEGPAILMHLADVHSEAQLIPETGSAERSQIVRWLLFFAVNVYEGELRKLFGARYTAEPKFGDAVSAAADEYVKRQYLIFEDELVGQPFFLNEKVTVLDIYVWMLAQWMDRAWLEANCPKISLLASAVKERPKVAPVHVLNFG